jgi:hypothetical protein
MDNAELALPELFVTLGGERFALIPSFGTFVRFEKATGKSGLDPLVWMNASASDYVTLLWASIGGEKSGKTVDDVADLMTGKHLEDVRKLVSEMFKKAELPDAVKNDDAVKQKAATKKKKTP